MKINHDRYITNLEVTRDEIKEIRLLQGKKKTMSQWYTETKADIICNGALYNTNGIPIESYTADGKILSTSDWCKYGFGINFDGSVVFGEVNPYYRDFTSAFPMLVKDGEVNIFPDISASIKAVNPRTVFSQTADGVMITTIDGRQTDKPGMTIGETAAYMNSLGVIHSANLDGGGSTHLMVGGNTVNSPCEDRAVSNVVAIWLKGNDKMKICIDAGHNYSKYDTGAEGNGLREQDITFEISKQVGDMLAGSGFDVKLTRDKLTENLGTNTNTSLLTRTNIANSWNADLFLSIHCNAFANSSASGTECYIYKLNNNAHSLATKINGAIVNSLGTANRGVLVKPNLAVLRNTNMPAILIETAFISNKVDADKLKNNKNDFARAIAQEVCNHYGRELKPVETPKIEANKYSFDDTVDNMVSDGVTTEENMAYWEQVLSGNKPVELENLRKILQRYHEKVK